MFAAPDNAVAPVIGAGTAALLLTTLPVAVPVVLKKSLPASMAEAATSVVLASVEIALVSAVLRLAAVAVEVAPMAKLPAGGGVALDAVSWIDCDVPSGRLNATLIVSPLLGLVGPRSTEIAAGDPEGPVTVAPVSVDDTALSFRPNGEPATSSATCTEVGVGVVSTTPSETVGAEIGLLPLGDHLLQPGLGGVAIEDIVDRGDRGRIDGAARKQIAVAGLHVENAEHRGQLRVRGLLADGLACAVQGLRSSCWRC